MKPTWTQIYPKIKAAVSNLESVEAFLQQLVEIIAETYAADCLLWSGLEQETLDTIRVFTTSPLLQQLENTADFDVESVLLNNEDDLLAVSPVAVSVARPRSLPQWLVDRSVRRDVVQLETGDLLVPVVSGSSPPQYSSGRNPDNTSNSHQPLQLVLQLRRSMIEFSVAERSTSVPFGLQSRSTIPQSLPSGSTSLQGWSIDEIQSLEIVASQIGLAISALHWRNQLEQSRQHVALVGRIARLLNSSLNPDEIVKRIVAELGQGLGCDRTFLADLRDDPIQIISSWNYSNPGQIPLNQEQLARRFWLEVIELFAQGGASHLQITATDTNVLQPWLNDQGADSVLLIPLFIQEEFFGTVALVSDYRTRHYQLDELQTVRRVADQAAIALMNVQHYQTLWHKQEALRMQNSPLQLESIRDELTQLMNRQALERELEQLSTKAMWTMQSPFSLIICDIDYFKLINDTHGHQVGDDVLCSLADRLQKQLRRETPAYRYDGEEFVIILSETELPKATEVAERLRQAVRSTPMETTAGAIDITVSFGIAQQQPLQDHDAWDVLNRASRALQDAKRQGRDRVSTLELA